MEIYEHLLSDDVEALSELYVESIHERVQDTRQSMHTRRLMRIDARFRLPE
tara:strand:- start:2230 stop:2382 length:153 start_codon:yes stop_codon:yes gene_type:complete